MVKKEETDDILTVIDNVWMKQQAKLLDIRIREILNPSVITKEEYLSMLPYHIEGESK